MILTAQELGAINVTLVTQAPEVDDRSVAKDIFLLLKDHIDDKTHHFKDGEMELSVPERAFLLKIIPLVPWMTPQLIEFVDPLLVKLNA